jgi:hypothetical protein
MNLNGTKGFLVAAALAAMSTGAVAQGVAPKAVKLSDAELDGITAGRAFVLVGVSNPGRAPEQATGLSAGGKVYHCVNCFETEAQGTSGLLMIWKPGTSPEDSQPFIMRPIRQLPY